MIDSVLVAVSFVGGRGTDGPAFWCELFASFEVTEDSVCARRSMRLAIPPVFTVDKLVRILMSPK